jgi:hypothetical protein
LPSLSAALAAEALVGPLLPFDAENLIARQDVERVDVQRRSMAAVGFSQDAQPLVGRDNELESLAGFDIAALSHDDITVGVGSPVCSMGTGTSLTEVRSRAIRGGRGRRGCVP